MAHLPVPPPDDEIGWREPRRLRGLELRYALTDLMMRQRRVWTVKELVAALGAAGFELDRRTESASKLVSGALRWEIGRGRVVRCGWGRYRAAPAIPGSTRRRIPKRAAARRRQVQQGTLTTRPHSDTGIEWSLATHPNPRV